MVKLIYLQIFAALVCTKYVYGDKSCDCFNPIYVDKPVDIRECEPDTFLRRISENYEKVYDALDKSGAECKFEEYNKFVKGMEFKAKALVKAYFSCQKGDDCKNALDAAYKKHRQAENRTFSFIFRNIFGYPSACSKVLMKTQPSVYSSPENIMTSLLACVKLRSKSKGSTQSTKGIAANSTKSSDCNCMKMDTITFPTSVKECLSDEYISKMEDFRENNFQRIEDFYREGPDSKCGSHDELYEHIIQMKIAASNMIDQWKQQEETADSRNLEATYEMFDFSAKRYSHLLRDYILQNNKKCYLLVRKLQHFPITVADLSLRITMKCILAIAKEKTEKSKNDEPKKGSVSFNR